MNVNDVVCVGAEPIALLDYLAVEQADPDVMEQIGIGLKRGAELAGVEIPGGEVAILPELIRGHPSPNGFDLTATCFGTVALDAIVTGEHDRARRRADRPAEQRPALELVHARAPRGRGPAARRRRSATARWPTRCSSRPSSTCAPRSTLLRSRHPRPRPRAHHRRRPAEPAAAQRRSVGFAIEDPLPVPPIIELVQERGERLRGRGVGGLQHGLRLRRGRARRRTPTRRRRCSRAHHPGTRRIGTVTDEAGRVAVPARGIGGDAAGLHRPPARRTFQVPRGAADRRRR